MGNKEFHSSVIKELTMMYLKKYLEHHDIDEIDLVVQYNTIRDAIKKEYCMTNAIDLP